MQEDNLNLKDNKYGYLMYFKTNQDYRLKNLKYFNTLSNLLNNNDNHLDDKRIDSYFYWVVEINKDTFNMST